MDMKAFTSTTGTVSRKFWVITSTCWSWWCSGCDWVISGDGRMHGMSSGACVTYHISDKTCRKSEIHHIYPWWNPDVQEVLSEPGWRQLETCCVYVYSYGMKDGTCLWMISLQCQMSKMVRWHASYTVWPSNPTWHRTDIMHTTHSVFVLSPLEWYRLLYTQGLPRVLSSNRRVEIHLGLGQSRILHISLYIFLSIAGRRHLAPLHTCKLRFC